MKKRILCMVLGIIMAGLCLTSFTYDAPDFRYFEPSAEETLVFPPETPKNLVIQLADEPSDTFVDCREVQYGFIENSDFPETLPETDLKTEFLFKSHPTEYGNLLITSQEELDCLFAWHYDWLSPKEECPCLSNPLINQEYNICPRMYRQSYVEHYKKLSQIDYSEKAVLLLEYNTKKFEISRIVIDQGRLIVVVTTTPESYESYHPYEVECVAPKGNVGLVVDKADLPVTDGGIEIYYCAEIPERGVYYDHNRVLYSKYRYYFTETDETTVIEPAPARFKP